MKKIVLLVSEIVSFVIVFIISLFLFSELLNKGNTDMTKEMEKPTIPHIYIEMGEYSINNLRGYANEMEAVYLRDNLTPIGKERKISFRIERFGNIVENVSFQVKSLDGSRLLEHTRVEDLVMLEDSQIATITLKDLLEENKDYILDIILTVDNKEIHYYTRIVQADSFHVKEHLDFVSYFNKCTFDKEEARNITRYLESNYKGDNTTLGNVNLYSSFNQITWAELNIECITSPVMTLREINNETATVHVDYIVSSNQEDVLHYYRIREYYRVRYTKDRMYLLQFERQMNQIMDVKQDIFTARTITLGIQSDDPKLCESANGDVVAFVNEDRVFCMNTSTNSLSYLYGSYDTDNFDVRTIGDVSEVEVLKVDETGNVTFMVYGYMSRGEHEGSVGISVYYYNSLYNAVEELVFIPYDKSHEILQNEIEKLSYLSKENALYFILNCNVYRVDLNSRYYEIIASNMEEDTYEVSDDHHMIFLQQSKERYRCSQLMLINLNTQTSSLIEAKEGEYLMPLGFMGDDVIYGVAKQEDIIKEATGSVLFPMQKVIIRNEIGEILKVYEQDGVYVTSGQIIGNQLVLNRIKINASGKYEYIEPDQILNNKVSEAMHNSLSKPVTQTYEKIVQINLAQDMKVKGLKIKTPKQMMYEGERLLVMSAEDVPEQFYVFSLRGMSGITTNASAAVRLAQQESGAVTDDNGQYIWSKGGLVLINQILAIKGEKQSEDRNSLAVCLDTILSLEGVVRNSALMLDSGMNAIEILTNNIEGINVLELTGCSLESMKYYLNRDIPVLAMLSPDKAVLLVGYNTTQIALMDPATGTIYKKSMSEASTWFAQNGNEFITYVK